MIVQMTISRSSLLGGIKLKLFFIVVMISGGGGIRKLILYQDAENLSFAYKF